MATIASLCILDVFVHVVQHLLQGERHSDRQIYCQRKGVRNKYLLLERGSGAWT